MPESDSALLARLDERTKSIEANLDKLEKTLNASMDALREELRVGFGDVRKIIDDHERRISALENKAKQGDSLKEWVRPVIVAILTAAALFIIGAIGYLIVSHNLIVR
ncbi:MAG: hypothetical protein N2559_17375 [Anaerolineae bacterium]|nr:hypothetical protein [Anaerolineae bacterium]